MARTSRKTTEESPNTSLEIIPRAKSGPVCKYHPDMANTLLAIAAEGGHISEMMVALNIRSKETFYRWQNDYPEFKEAYEFSKIISQAYHEKLGREGASGKIPNFNATAYALIMNNKFGDEYKRGSGGGSNTEITINTLNVDPTQRQLKIAQKIEQLKSLGVDLNIPEGLVDEQ